jgi:maltose-binding protein MalE
VELKVMKKNLLIIVSMIIVISFLAGCTSNPINQPQFSITSQTKRDALEGPDRVGYVEITIQNNGGSGSRTVSVTVTQGSNSWTKEQSPFVENGQSTSLTFRFQEIAFWTTTPWDFNVIIK